MSTLQTIDIMIGNEKLQQVDDAIYLGQLISLKNKTSKEINRRITIGWKKILVPKTYIERASLRLSQK